MMEREDETKVDAEPKVIVTDIRPKRLEDAVKSAVSGAMACFYVESWRQHEQEESIVRQEVMVSVRISLRRPKEAGMPPMESEAHVPMLISSDYMAWLEKQWKIYQAEGEAIDLSAEVEAAPPLLLETPPEGEAAQPEGAVKPDSIFRDGAVDYGAVVAKIIGEEGDK